MEFKFQWDELDFLLRLVSEFLSDKFHTVAGAVDTYESIRHYFGMDIDAGLLLYAKLVSYLDDCEKEDK